jgi:hypothetical protein
MESRTYTVINYDDLNKLLIAHFGWAANYNIVEDLIDDYRWRNDTCHSFLIDKENASDDEVMDHELAAIISDRQIKYNYRIASTLRSLMHHGEIPWGNVLVEVWW